VPSKSPRNSSARSDLPRGRTIARTLMIYVSHVYQPHSLWSLMFGASLELGAWNLELPRASARLIRFRGDDQFIALGRHALDVIPEFAFAILVHLLAVFFVRGVNAGPVNSRVVSWLRAIASSRRAEESSAVLIWSAVGFCTCTSIGAVEVRFLKVFL